MPMIGRLRMLRSWGGVMDMSMDGSPIIDRTPVEGLYLNAGWCYGGFKATPGSGLCFAHLIARDEPHPVAAALRLDRFARGTCHRREGRGRRSPICTDTPCEFPAPIAATRDLREFSYLGDAKPVRPDPDSADASSASTIPSTARQPAGPHASFGITPPAARLGSSSSATRARMRLPVHARARPRPMSGKRQPTGCPVA